MNMNEFSDLAYKQKTSQKKEVLPHTFLKGNAPSELNGFYKGKLELLLPQTPLEYIAFYISKLYCPWQGKEFHASSASGINILSSHTKFLAKFFFQNAIGENSLGGYRAFPFRTSITRGIIDPINVLRLDYDVAENPSIVRRVIDEIVEINDGSYLGKAHIKVQNGTRLIAFFRLFSID